MNTPTPRTDAAWASSFEPCEYRAAHTARTMRDECERLETELARLRPELEKVYALVTPDGCDLMGGIFETAQAVTELRTERDQLRAALALGQQNCDDAYDDLRAERAAAIARAESAEREAFDWKKIARYETARAERAEREVQRLKSDGAASAFVNMSCRASRAETDRNNLRADKARLDWLEKARPIAWALGSEECGEYWILTDTGEKHPEEAEEFATLRAAIDAAMKEGA